jgi:hypothetical protein
MRHILIMVLLFSCFTSFSQNKPDTIYKGVQYRDIDSSYIDTIRLPDLYINKEVMTDEDRKNFLLLQSRVYKVYPFAKIASERLVELNKNMDKLKTTKEKKKYFKIIENYMENEFTGQLKKLSRKQGQILVKLIHRQTGYTTFDLIKDYKSGWKAFWSNNTARLFDINLKSTYNPKEVNEDYLIETILYRAFNRGRLPFQKPAYPIDIDELDELWFKN